MTSSKVIVVTGASSGIGAELASQLGAQGHRLALAARREKELSEVASQSGAETITAVTDVRSRADINNAGHGIGKSVLVITDEDFDEMRLVNTKSAR